MSDDGTSAETMIILQKSIVVAICFVVVAFWILINSTAANTWAHFPLLSNARADDGNFFASFVAHNQTARAFHRLEWGQDFVVGAPTLPTARSVAARLPTVSVISPALAGDVIAGKMLEGFFKSISAQTLLPKEVVMALSDTDGATCAKLFQYAKELLPPSVLFRANCTYERLNQADARNAAVQLSTGDLCLFLDADDRMHFQKVELVSKLFHENPSLQAFAHGSTRDSKAFEKPIIPLVSQGITQPASANVTHILQHKGVTTMWGDRLASAARGKRSLCTSKCWIVRGMVPGSSTARRTAVQQVPFTCKRRNGADRPDGGCFAEDSFWFRNILMTYPKREDTLFINVPLIVWVPSGMWKRPARYDKQPEGSLNAYTAQAMVARGTAYHDAAGKNMARGLYEGGMMRGRSIGGIEGEYTADRWDVDAVRMKELALADVERIKEEQDDDEDDDDDDEFDDMDEGKAHALADLRKKKHDEDDDDDDDDDYELDDMDEEKAHAIADLRKKKQDEDEWDAVDEESDGDGDGTLSSWDDDDSERYAARKKALAEIKKIKQREIWEIPEGDAEEGDVEYDGDEHDDGGAGKGGRVAAGDVDDAKTMESKKSQGLNQGAGKGGRVAAEDVVDAKTMESKVNQGLGDEHLHLTGAVIGTPLNAVDHDRNHSYDAGHTGRFGSGTAELDQTQPHTPPAIDHLTNSSSNTPPLALEWIATLPSPYPSLSQPPLPTKLHFVWTSPYLQGDGSVPTYVGRNVESWRLMHPGWDVKIWTNALVVRAFPELVELLSNISTPAWHADILSFAITAKFGGIYVDTDIQPVHSLDPLVKYIGSFILCNMSTTENHIWLDNCPSRVIHAVHGFYPGHRIPVEMSRKAVEVYTERLRQMRPHIVTDETSPPHWDAGDLAGKSNNIANVTLLGVQTFEPCSAQRHVSGTCNTRDYDERSDVFGARLLRASD